MLDITDGTDLGTGWTPARILLLRKLFADGLTHRAIAEQLGGGLSRNAVIGKAGRLGLVGRERAARMARKFSHGGGDGTVSRIRSGIKTRKALADKDRSLTQTINNARERTFPTDTFTPSEQPQEFLGVTFEALDGMHCRFPRGDSPSITFCGQPRMPGQSYCRACYRIAYYRPAPSANRAPWINWGGR